MTVMPPETSNHRILIVSAEASGDFHAAHVVRRLKAQHPSLIVDALGGEALEAAGARLVAHINALSVMGLSEVLWALPRILRIRRQIVEAIKSHQYRCAILVDGPDFNFGLFKHLKRAGVPIVYYIPPKLWASRARRIKKLQKYADVICAIFPFEADWYAQRQVETIYVGHPVAEQTGGYLDAQASEHKREEETVLALLPGSRTHEIQRLMPYYKDLVLRLKKEFKHLRFVVPQASTVSDELLQPLKDLGVAIESTGTLTVLHRATAAVVASGTATLETALMQVPQVVVYRVGWLTAVLYHLLVRLRYVSPVNIILDRFAVPELLQGKLTHESLYQEVCSLLVPSAKRTRQLEDCQKLQGLLQGQGASEAVADIVGRHLK